MEDKTILENLTTEKMAECIDRAAKIAAEAMGRTAEEIKKSAYQLGKMLEAEVLPIIKSWIKDWKKLEHRRIHQRALKKIGANR